MAAINFPDSPSVNDTINVGDKTWRWDGTYWRVLSQASSIDTLIKNAANNTKVEVEQTLGENVIRFTTAGTEQVTIDSSGRVGIGTTSPNSTLEVSGTVQTGNITVMTDGGIDDPTIVIDPADGLGIIRRGSGYMDIYAINEAESGYDDLSLNGSVTINSSGNVGINDSTPSYKLDVNGDINATGDLLVNGTSINRLPPNYATTNKTLALADASTWVAESGAGDRTLTIPLNSSVAFPIGTQILVSRSTASAVTIAAASGVTLYSTLGSGDVTIGNVNGFVTLLKYTADEWYAIGDVA